MSIAGRLTNCWDRRTVVCATGLPKVGSVTWNDKFYVKLRVDGTMKRKTISVGSHNPNWNQSFSLYEFLRPMKRSLADIVASLQSV